MKKTFIILLFIITALSENVKAQVFLLDTFYLSATESIYGIYADINVSSSKLLYFDMEAPNDEQRVQVQLSINSDLNSFISSLWDAKTKFEEWEKIAHSNSIKTMTKTIPVRFRDEILYFTQDEKWYHETGVDMMAEFYVNSLGQCHLIIKSDYMTSSELVSYSFSYGSSFATLMGSNKWAWNGNMRGSKTYSEKYCGGASLSFSSSKEIETFVAKLNKVAKWKANNTEIVGYLFK
ncbi:MAG: hypothetical protein K6A67_08550 [Bacteroidales bacterium]|nr:hypothetical protein [Bacteroidales bacterium]